MVSASRDASPPAARTPISVRSVTLTAPAPRADADATDFATALRARLGDAEGRLVDTSVRRRAEYSSDASNYRIVPEVVVFPRDADDVEATLELARAHGLPITPRGGGTSIAGNAIGPGVVLDFSRHMNRILDIDPVARTARVEPGVVMGALQKAAAPHGLRFGPDPSTWARATLGGMIGNDACGNHSIGFGRTNDNVIEMELIDGDGRRFTASDDLAVVPGLDDFVARHLAVIRTEFGRFGRQVSGYSLEHLLPERGHSVARALVGTEGTCGVLLSATVRLVDVPIAPLLVVLGYPSMADAADAVPTVLSHGPGAIEGLGRDLVDIFAKARGAAAVPDLPEGAGWLLVEMSGADPAETRARAEKLLAASGASGSAMYEPGPAQSAIWKIREDGAGLAGRTLGGEPAWPALEDAAVPPEKLGAYLRDFEALLDAHGVEGVPYGHFGDGCIHVRVSLPMERDGSALRAFMEDAADLVVSHGGSISGEHGDGRARGELVAKMYSAEAQAAMAEFKALFDPHGRLNPGVGPDPAPLDADLRRPSALPTPKLRGLAFLHDGGDLTAAAHRCVGVGKCRVPSPAAGTFMCPSFAATQDEKDSTRGRARVLQETITGITADGAPVTGGWRSPELAESLDLCLSCKACSSDCPAGVDMAAYKSEVLHRRYAGRIRPVSHYLLGRLPFWSRLIAPFAPLANALLTPRWIQRIVLAIGGMDKRRSFPKFASRRFLAGRRPEIATTGRPEVVLWVDSFSDCFSPDIAHSALTVLDDAGFDTVLPEGSACCGLTWITTGQLDAARAKLANLVDTLHPHVAAGRRILGLEPSCTATLRSDLVELLPDDPRAAEVAAAVTTLAELLAAPARDDWTPPRLDGTRLVVQPHCHHHAVMGFAPDRALLETAGAEIQQLSGCCGLAGNFGMERGHYEVSVAVAERGLLPALRDAPDDAILLADGFSCRTQADQLAGREGVHLAQVLAGAIEADRAARASAG